MMNDCFAMICTIIYFLLCLLSFLEQLQYFYFQLLEWILIKKKLYLIGTLKSRNFKILRYFLKNPEKQKQKLTKNVNFYTKPILIKFYYNSKMNYFRKLKFSINMYFIIFNNFIFLSYLYTITFFS